MHRRNYLAGISTVALGTVAGCAAPRSERTHPFADRTVTVRIDDRSDTAHDLQEITADSLAYWTEHSAEYAGFEIAFDVVDEESPDIAIVYADDSSDCSMVDGYSERVLGCAPVLRPESRVRDTVRAIVVAGTRPVGKIRTTTKHELGHILGLGHEDEPLEIMSNRPEDRIPQYALRIDIWETVLETHRGTNEAFAVVSHGVDAWNDGAYADAVAFLDAGADDLSALRDRLVSARNRTDEFDADERVETVELLTLRTHLSRVLDRLRHLETFARHLADAARANADGDSETASARRSDALDSLDAYNAAGSTELREIAIALGLVRGFDRDVPVADVDEDEIEA